MRAAFACTYDAQNPSLWAGSTFHMTAALQRHGIELHHISPLRERRALYYKAMQVLYGKLARRALHRDRQPAILDGYAEQVARRLDGADVDLVFSPGSVAIAHLKTSLPIVFWTDATYDAIVREYVWEPPPARRSLRLGHKMEARALSNVALAIYTSEWAARSAIEDYGADPAKVKVVPFGANIDVARTASQVDAMIDARPLAGAGPCRLLFIGIGWERKGGDIAVEVARRLNARGVPAELTLLGSNPPSDTALPDFVKPLGYLDKRSEEGRHRFDGLFGSSHFLLLPARAEAFGVVLCEACSFGVPCLAGRVGGIPTIIRDGVNGYLFDRDADPDLYADRIAALLHDVDAYRHLARSTFAEYESRLNWDVAARTVRGLLEPLVPMPH